LSSSSSLPLSGNEKYDIRIKSLVSGSQEDIDVIQECGSSVEWGNDDSTIFYTKLDEELRPFQIWLHTIGLSFLLTPALSLSLYVAL
jgi:oligopeptidase B